MTLWTPTLLTRRGTSRARRSRLTRAHALGALAAGVALALAFPAPNLAPLAWVAVAPLIALVPAAGAGAGAGLGFLFGLGFFGTLLAWISLVGWVSWAALVAAQAAFVALFGAAWAVAGRGAGRATRLLAPPVLWVALVEYLRSLWPFGGFPWGQLVQSQHDLPWLLKSASLAGGWLTGGLVVLVNAALLEALRARRATAGGVALPVVVALAALAAPALLPAPAAGRVRSVAVGIVQGALPSGFAGDTVARELAITARHRRLTGRLAGHGLDLVVWPESALGLDPSRTPQVAADVRAAARAVDAPLLVGGNRDVGADRYEVVALLVSPRGRVVDRYQKTHLVPFGEYVPARRYLGWIPMLDQIPRDAIAGSRPELFEVAGGTVAPVISYEGDFGSLVRARIARGGRLLVVATNTSTWGRSWASAQHVAFSQVRAAENGVWVVHAALSGISAFVNPAGRVVAATPLDRPATLEHTVRFAGGITPYARLGDWFPRACLVAAALVVVAGALRRETRWWAE